MTFGRGDMRRFRPVCPLRSKFSSLEDGGTGKFPADYMFMLTEDELSELRSRFLTANARAANPQRVYHLIYVNAVAAPRPSSPTASSPPLRAAASASLGVFSSLQVENPARISPDRRESRSELNAGCGYASLLVFTSPMTSAYDCYCINQAVSISCKSSGKSTIRSA